MAKPASKRLISSRSVSSVLEPVQLRLQQLGAAGHRRVELVALGEDQVGGHPDGGQRGAQLVRDVGGEPALEPGHLLQPQDLPLQVGRHLVEGGGEQGEVVLAVDHHPLVEQAGGEPLGGPRGHPDRGHHQPGDQGGEQAEQQHQGHPGGQYGGPGVGGGGVLPVERDEVVQLQLAEAGRHRGAVDQVSSASPVSRPVRIWWATLPSATAARSSRLTSGRTSIAGEVRVWMMPA